MGLMSGLFCSLGKVHSRLGHWKQLSKKAAHSVWNFLLFSQFFITYFRTIVKINLTFLKITTCNTNCISWCTTFYPRLCFVGIFVGCPSKALKIWYLESIINWGISQNTWMLTPPCSLCKRSFNQHPWVAY